MKLITRCVMLLCLMTLSPGMFVKTYAALSDYWLFVYNRETGEIMSMLPDGTSSHDLLTIGADGRPLSWRLAPDQVLIMVEEGESQVYYHLTPDTATRYDPLAMLPEPATGLEFVYAADYHPPYVLFVEPQPPTGLAFLLNLQAGTVEWLTGFVSYRQVFFSEDGQFVRYASSTTDSGEATISILERDLATGEERTITQVETEAMDLPFSSSPDGTYWLHRESLQTDAGRELHFYLIHLDGSQEEIGVSSAANIVNFQLLQRYLLFYRADCHTDCSIEVQSLDTGEAHSYSLPELSSFQPITVIGEDLLLMSGAEIWRLTPGGGGFLLGYYAPQNLAGTGFILSPDKRYLITLDAEDASENFQVWDLLNQEMIVSEPHDVFASYTYFENGFVVRDAPFEDLWYIPYETGEPLKLPVVEGGIFAAPTADGLFPINQIREGHALIPGIHLYNPADDSYTTLIEGSWEVLGAVPIFHPIR